MIFNNFALAVCTDWIVLGEQAHRVPFTKSSKCYGISQGQSGKSPRLNRFTMGFVVIVNLCLLKVVNLKMFLNSFLQRSQMSEATWDVEINKAKVSKGLCYKINFTQKSIKFDLLSGYSLHKCF